MISSDSPHRPAKFKIGEAAKKAGTSVRSLRHLDDMGVLRPEFRDPNGYRYYSERDIERLTYINLLQLAGFTLREIPALLSAQDTREEFIVHARMLRNKGRTLMLLGEFIEESISSLNAQSAPQSLERFHERLGSMSEEFHEGAQEEANTDDPHKELVTLLRTLITRDERSILNFKRLLRLVPMLGNQAYFDSFMIMIRVYKSNAFKLDELDTIEKNFLKLKKELESPIV